MNKLGNFISLERDKYELTGTHLPPVHFLLPSVLRGEPSGQTGLAPPQVGVLHGGGLVLTSKYCPVQISKVLSVFHLP